MRDLLREINQKLSVIAEQSSVDGGDVNIDISEQREQYHDPTEENTAKYFSTGSDRVQTSQPGGDIERLEFGFLAGTVTIRHDGPLYVWMGKPSRNQPIVLEGSGKSILGEGSDPLGTAFLWLQTPESEDEPTHLRVEARPA